MAARERRIGLLMNEAVCLLAVSAATIFLVLTLLHTDAFTYYVVCALIIGTAAGFFTRGLRS